MRSRRAQHYQDSVREPYSLGEYASEENLGRTGQAAIRFPLIKSSVGVVLVGFSAMDQIEEAAGA